MDIRDAHNRQTQALILGGAPETRTRKSRPTGTHKTTETSHFTTNLAHVFMESAARCHFQYPSGETLIVMEGAPKCCLPVTEALRQPKERNPFLQHGYDIYELTWSDVQSLTPKILCSLISSCCHLPLLPTFNDIVSRIQAYGAVLSPLMAPRTDDRRYISIE